jgi:hypothetical protein
MEANIVDLRYKMKEVLRALARNEKVRIKYRGKVKGIITPDLNKDQLKIQDHEFFGMHKDDEETVEQVMEKLRGSRY